MNAATATTLADIITATHAVTDNQAIQHAVWDVLILDKAIEYVAIDRSISLHDVRNFVAKTKAAIFQSSLR